MNQLINAVLSSSEEKAVLQQLITSLRAANKAFFLRNEILHIFAEICQETRKPAHFFHSSSLGMLIHYTHELILEEDQVWFILRPWIGSQQMWRVDAELTQCEQMSPKALLETRDRLVGRYEPRLFEIDVTPFYEVLPSIQDPRNIGQGLAFLNRYLCEQVICDRDYWLATLFDVLQHHDYGGRRLLINDRIESGEQFAQQIKKALENLAARSPEEPYQSFHDEFQDLGFEPGWGNTAGRVRESLELLDQMIHEPQPAILEAFVTRFPSVFRVVLVSVHGWVGQEHVLGRAETLGQVAYVLEQARSLEHQLREEMHLAGLDVLGIEPEVIILTRLIPNCEGTQCDLRLEQVNHTKNAWILRVPFREFNPNVTENWISKFEIWPYLETFAEDAEQELLKHMGKPPDLIIGNYSDGNLVASLLAQRMQVTQCNIAHSLEKPKHLFSNLYWQDLEPQYHFSAQFTADVIGMNAADFIVTSSYQEIVGTPDTLGQYESYKHFTMPQLYHVLNGIDLFSPKFNRIPPGVDERIFFPYSQLERRPIETRHTIAKYLFEQEDPRIIGKLSDPNKCPILAIAPVISVKNLAGLTECFGRSPELQERCNLILITNKLSVDEAINPDEAEQIQTIHNLIDQYHLHDHIRWVGSRLATDDLGEVYRSVADRQGFFVLFARFEAFGRVLLEAMISGLPVFATEFGGAVEVIEDDRYGFLINPTDLDGSARKMLEFLDRCAHDPKYWQEISERGMHRIHDEYNWTLHTRQLLLLTKLYSFWNYVHRESREALLRYLQALFFLVYKPRAEAILDQHMQQ
jgi:sucrose synthase